jgi:putative ABC transport system permease protein
MTRVWRLLTGEPGAGPALALAVIALLAAFVATAGPREITSLQNRALRQTLAAAGPFGISATGYWQINGPTVLGALKAGQIQRMTNVIGGSMRPPLVSPAAQQWGGLTMPLLGVLNPPPKSVLGGPPLLEVAYRSALASNAKLIYGTLPQTAAESQYGKVITIQVAVTTATAHALGLRVGTVLDLGRTAAMPPSDPAIVLDVTGLLRPVGPSSPFWTRDPSLAAPTLFQGVGGPQIWAGGVFVGPNELAELATAYDGATATLSWNFPLKTAGLTAAQAPGMLAAMTSLVSGNAGEAALQAAGPPLQNPPVLTADGSGTLSGFITAQAAVATTDALLLAGVAAATAILLLVGALVIADAYRGELTLDRARGGSLRQIAVRILALTAGVAGPALVIGVAAAVMAVPGGGNTASWALAALVVVIALAAPALLAAWELRGLRSLAGPGRADLVIRRPSARRLVVEATALVVVVGGVVALRVRGVAPGAGVDPYLSSAAVLIAVAAGLIAARVYPVPLRVLLRILTRRRGTVGYLGVARSARSRSVPLLPALALVVAMAVIALGGMIRAAVTSGQVAASWQQVGADAVVLASGTHLSIDPKAQAAMAAVPGVRHGSAVYVIDPGSDQAGNLLVGQTGAMSTGVVIASPGQYAALVADTPWPAFPARLLARPAGSGTGAIPVIASPSVGARIRAGSDQLAFASSELTLRVAAVASSTPALPGGGAFIIMPSWVSARLAASTAPNTMLLTGPDINVRDLRAVVARTQPGGQLISRADVLAVAANSPTVHGSDLAFELSVAAAVACAAGAVLLGVLLSGRDRTRLGVWLTAMGMTARQARRLALLDALPLLLIAILGGEAAGLALGPLIGPGLDLSAFTGSSAPVAVRPDLVALLAPAVGAVALITAVAVGQNALIRSRSGSVLRMDE